MITTVVKPGLSYSKSKCICLFDDKYCTGAVEAALQGARLGFTPRLANDKTTKTPLAGYHPFGFPSEKIIYTKKKRISI